MQKRMSASGTCATALSMGWQCQAGIDRCESRHSLACAAFAHSRGGIHNRPDAAQQKRAMDVMRSAQRGGSGARHEDGTGGAPRSRGEWGTAIPVALHGHAVCLAGTSGAQISPNPLT